MGRYLLRELLQRGISPVVTSRQDPGALGEEFQGKVDLASGDVSVPGFLDRVLQQHPVEVVVHLVAVMGAPAEQPAGFALNAALPVAVYQAAVQHGVRRVVLASSMSVYGKYTGVYGYPEFRPIDESYPRQPTSLYGVAKWAAEESGRLYRMRHGLEFIALRFGPYFGPDRPPGGHPGIGTRLSTSLHRAAIGEDVTLPVWAGYCFDPIYVADCARALAQAAIASALPPVEAPWVHCSSQSRLTFADVGRAIGQVVPGCEIRYEDDPTNQAEMRAQQSCVTFDNARARQWLGHTPAYPFEAACEHFVAAVRQLRQAR